MKRINIKGVLAILGMCIGTGILVHDFISLIFGATYTIFGLYTLVLVLMMMSICKDYIDERLK